MLKVLKNILRYSRDSTQVAMRRRRLQKLLFKAKNHKSNVTTSMERILFWVPGGMDSMLHVEGAVAIAKQFRGAEVLAILCDGVSTACIRREFNDGTKVTDWGKVCKSCSRQTSNTLKGMNIPFKMIGDLISKEEKNHLLQLAGNFDFQKIKSLTYLDVLIGANVQSSIYRYLKGYSKSSVGESFETIVKLYTFTALVNAHVSNKLINDYQPTHIFMSHGIYTDWGPCLHIAKKKQLPVTLWMAAYKKSCFYFRTVVQSERIEPQYIEPKIWDQIAKKPLSAIENAQLDDFIRTRYEGSKTFDMKKMIAYNDSDANVIEKITEKGRPIWGIFSHVNWDCVSDYAKMIYSDFNAWILETLKIIAAISEVEWVIKIHPAESWENPQSGIYQLILDHYDKLPDNIHILTSEDKISPKRFYECIHGAITMYGTPGLEIALMGKPVILAGEAHYGQKGFTYDAKNILHYERLLRNASKYPNLNQNEIALARKYAYTHFISRQIPLEIVNDKNSEWWAFQYQKIETLLPGKDRIMDFICDRITKGSTFILEDNIDNGA